MLSEYEISGLSDEALRQYIADLETQGYRPSQFGSRETIDGNVSLLAALQERETREEGWKLVAVGFDDGPIAMGWINGHRWNGWLEPLLTKGEAERAARGIDAMNAELPEEHRAEQIYFTQQGEEFLFHDPNYAEEEDYAPGRILPEQVAGIPEPVYDFSLGLTWVEWTAEEMTCVCGHGIAVGDPCEYHDGRLNHPGCLEEVYA